MNKPSTSVSKSKRSASSNQNNRDQVGSDYLDMDGSVTGTEIVNDEMYIVGYFINEFWKRDSDGNLIFLGSLHSEPYGIDWQYSTFTQGSLRNSP